MKKLFAIIMATIITTGLVACKSATKATIYNDKSEVLTVVEDSTSLSELTKAWNAKERALEKLMPLFEYKVEMDIDGKKEIWMFNKGGYLMKEGSSFLYKTPQKEVFSNLVK